MTTPVTLRLDRLDELARFTAYLRLETENPAAEGFGIDGAVMIVRDLSRDSWEGLGCPVELPARLRNVAEAPIVVPGVTGVPGIVDRLREALRAVDETDDDAEMFPPAGSHEAALNTLASYVRDLLVEVDGARPR